MNFENMNIWCWLIPLLVGLLCALFGYLLGKGSAKTIDNTAELKLCQDKNAKLQADLDACTQELSAVPPPQSSVSSSLGAIETAVPTVLPFDAAAAKAVFGKNIKQDDLKVIEGIGPKIEGLFKGAGISTWKALSETSVASCKEVLATGGDRYKVHDPASWPMQAKMCYEGKWAELAKWQDEHDHGRL
ncbi:hypothetical protein [Pseudozobellia thermophila]|uniref:Predicted 5' DNA nuclease, flap endonuclease-1-like, helix-3-turn-helix (H3TH) domain n=1 Tax=Pseudozobellia thermophila TaxID=192903 RepID=A0A1M6AY02_9FLAO|nr:hypothetical protein [Pseudozobellia thermophila]SHI41345.1 Predicted 5' DNA nuclease, flap endonuclease-1-like, helix-3-turn-helix (H3TH) domain [Pseudozobellia thermophila]